MNVFSIWNRDGASILSIGDLIGAAEIGLLATVGIPAVKAYRRPKVAVLSNGDEVVDASIQKLGFGKIRDSNRPMLVAAAMEAGCETIDMGIAGDSEGSLQSKFNKAIQDGADVILTSGNSYESGFSQLSMCVIMVCTNETIFQQQALFLIGYLSPLQPHVYSTGGVSMGAKDLIKPLLESMGKVLFGKVKMKPGKPLTFAVVEQSSKKVLVFALPGNPVLWNNVSYAGCFLCAPWLTS